MSNEQNYHPRSPDHHSTYDDNNNHPHPPHPPPRLHRLPSYTIQEPSLPKGYSFSPRGSYDASPFFSPVSTQPSSYFGSQIPSTSPHFSPASLPNQQSPAQVKHAPSPTPSRSQSQPQPDVLFQPPGPSQPVQPVAASYTHSASVSLSQPPAFTGIEQQYQSPTAVPGQVPLALYQHYDEDMARLRQRKPVNYNENHNGPVEHDVQQTYVAHPQAVQQPPHMLPQQFSQPIDHFAGQPPPLPLQPLQPQQPQQSLQQYQQSIPPGPMVLPKVDVRTKFPVARIKRIMQADEDVGKVAQATPSAVSKALELFMIALVTKGASEAKSQNSKRVTATHLKTALVRDPQFDFLNDICESVPDEGSKKRAKSETKDSDSDDEIEGKKKGKARKKKTGSEMDSD